MKQDLIKFIKFGLRNKWAHLSEDEIDAIISEHIYVEEVHVGNELLPSVRHAITYDEITNGKIENLLEWGDNNLRDIDFWEKVKYTVHSFEPKMSTGILALVLHFEDKDDAVLFVLCWK